MTDLSLNIGEAVSALTLKPLFSTQYERVSVMNEIGHGLAELPQPLRFSRMLGELLSRVSTPLEPYDLIAGRVPDRELTSGEEALYQSALKDPDSPSKKVFLSSGHCTYSWASLVKLGLPGLKRRAEETLERVMREDPPGPLKDGKAVFLRGMTEVYGALSAYMLRYAGAAEKAGMGDVASNLRAGAIRAPASFAEALQLLWIVALVDCAYITKNHTLTLGRLDRILLPLYRADIASGRLDEDGARAVITDYYCKHNLIMGRGEHQLGTADDSTTFDRILNFDAPQYLPLAGRDLSGQPADNELTALFCECIRPEFKNPVAVVSYYSGMEKRSPGLWRTVCEKALGSSSMMIYNDENVVRTFMKLGLPEEDARRYEHFGCNWPSTGDNGCWIQGSPSAVRMGVGFTEEEKEYLRRPLPRHRFVGPECFMEALEDVAKLPEPERSTDALYCRFFARFSDFIDMRIKTISRELGMRARRPSGALTFTDCFRDAPAETGLGFCASSKYRFELMPFLSFATTADCFTAVDRLVFREKKVSCEELLDALKRDFEGCPRILGLCRNAPKFGCGDPDADAHALRLAAGVADLVAKKSCACTEENEPGFMLMPSLESDTWHIKYGELGGATPDGRRAHTPYSQNSRPSNGSATAGITGMLGSMLNAIPPDGFLSGALNLDVPKGMFDGEEGLRVFSGILASYFERGGLHAQVSVADVSELRDAQRHPELHRDLRVRVTGYSGIFVDMCRRLQDDVIARMEQE